MQPWTPLSGAEFENVFGPTSRSSSSSRVRQRRTEKRRKSNLQVENLEVRAVPTVFASVIGSSLASTPSGTVAVGEVIRYRIVSEIPFDNAAYSSLDLASYLPSGLTFLNDGTARIGLVSDAGINSSLGAPGSDLYFTGNDDNIGGITPTFAIQPSILSGGRELRFAAGQLTVFDDDANHEYVVIEFSALVNNEGTTPADSNDAGDVLSAGFQLIVGKQPFGDIAQSDVTVLEPSITDTAKTATAIPNGVRYTLTFSNTGSSIAYNVKLRDSIPDGLAFQLNTLNIVGGTGISIAALLTSFEVNFDEVAVGGSVTITYDALFDGSAAPGAQLTNTANVDYTSLPGENGEVPNETGSVTPGASGAADGERNGSGGINDYVGAASTTIIVPGGGGKAVISGVVKCDDNVPGIHDGPEPGIGGVTISLYDAAGNLVGVTTTDATGFYQFINLVPGTYRIVETQPAGLPDSFDVVGTVNGQTVGFISGNDEISGVTVNAGDVGVMYCFLEICDVQKAQLSGFVYVDANNNCIFEAGETPIAGVKMDLLDANGNLVATTSTDANGFYQFLDLAPGTYSVRQQLQTTPPLDNYEDGCDTPGTTGGDAGPNMGRGRVQDAITGIVLNPGANSQQNNFGEIPKVPGLKAQLSGYVFVDANDDCIFQANEAPIAGVIMELLDAAGNVIATTTTNAAGFYQFIDLNPGTYTVRQQPQAQPPLDQYDDGCDTPGTTGGDAGPNMGRGRPQDSITNIVLRGGDNSQQNNFGEIPKKAVSLLSGFVFCDENSNGRPDGGEHVFGGVTIRLTGGNLAAPLFTVTAADGSYSFNNLAAGTYQINLVGGLPPSFVENGQTMVVINSLNAVPGTINGVQVGTGTNSMIAGVVLPPAAASVHNDFPVVCTTPQATGQLSGHVFLDFNNNCLVDTPFDLPISGATIRCVGVDANGTVIYDQTMLTDINGFYQFTNMPAGTYRVIETQPIGFLDGGESLGTLGGTVSNDMFSDIPMPDGGVGLNYDFWETLPGPPPPPSKGSFLASTASPGGATGVQGFGPIVINESFLGKPAQAPTFNGTNLSPRTGVRYLVTGADQGFTPTVRVFDYLSGTQRFNFQAYESAFTGGVRVATGDVTGDGIADIITAPGFGGGPVIRVWDGSTGAMLREFNAYSADFRGGVYVAVGDTNGDGRYEIITGAGEGGGPHVKVFTVTGSGAAIAVRESASFMAYDSAFRGGVRITAADFNMDGNADIVTAPGVGGGPHVKIFNLSQPAAGGFGLIRQFMAFDPRFTGGIYVAATSRDGGDITGDGRPDLVVAAGELGGPHVKVYSGTDFSLFNEFSAMNGDFTGGIRVGVMDANGDGRSDVILGTGAGKGAYVRVVSFAAGRTDVDFFQAYDPAYTGGVYVAGG